MESLKDRSWVLNIHINNISKACHKSGVALFADDTEIHFSSKDVGKAEYIINKGLKSINQWFSNNGLICNTKKMVTMVISSHRAVKTARDVHISYGDSLLEQKRSFKYLSVIVDESFSWNSHFLCRLQSLPQTKLLNRISSFLDPTTLLTIYKATILPILDYGCILWGSCSKKNSDFVERLQNKAMRTILRANHLTCSQTTRDKLGLLTLSSRWRLERVT